MQLGYDISINVIANFIVALPGRVWSLVVGARPQTPTTTEVRPLWLSIAGWGWEAVKLATAIMLTAVLVYLAIKAAYRLAQWTQGAGDWLLDAGWAASA